MNATDDNIGTSTRLLPHPIVTDVVHDYLRTVDSEQPGLIEGLYLVGSVALGDFRVHTSDIDFIAVISGGTAGGVLDSLERAHARLRAQHKRPFFDGIYVTSDELGRSPLPSQEGPHTHAGRFHRGGHAERHPVAWHTLAHHGVTVRGPMRERLSIWTDHAALRSWVTRNLKTYWRAWRERSIRLASRNGIIALSPSAAAWGVLGVSRLHFTLATGGITSKDGAGVYALDAFGARWHRLVMECLRIRRASSGRSNQNPFTRRRELLDFIQMVMDDAAWRFPVEVAPDAGLTGGSQ